MGEPCREVPAAEVPTQAPELDRAVDSFMSFARVEAGLAESTLEAYGRDLSVMCAFLVVQGVRSPGEVTMEHLAAHLRHLSRDRGLDARTIVRHLATCGSCSAGCTRTSESSATRRASSSGRPPGSGSRAR